MPRTIVTVQNVAANGGGIQSITKTAADSANGMYFNNDGRTTFHVQNLDASSKTVTVVSVPDTYGRSGDLVLVVPAASAGDPGCGIGGPFPVALWNQSGLGQVFVNFSAATSTKVWATSLQGFQAS